MKKVSQDLQTLRDLFEETIQKNISGIRDGGRGRVRAGGCGSERRVRGRGPSGDGRLDRAVADFQRQEKELVEAFEEEVKQAIGALKGLQDNLGDFNDYGVQQETLHAIAGELMAAGRT